MNTADPFRIEPPFLVLFSGGRTSGYLLRRVLDAYDGVLPPDCHVVFNNTGATMDDRLDPREGNSATNLVV